MKRIDQAEINYIFKNNLDSRLNELDFMRDNLDSRLDDTIVNTLTKNPVVALSAAWKHSILRSGLTPFTIHYLTGSKLPIEDFMKKYFSRKYVSYGFCYSTNLPVVTCRISRNWQPPYRLHVPPAYLANYRSRSEEASYLNRRDSRFEELYHQLRIDKAAGLVDDEYMRQFGNHAVPKNIWTYLKGVAGIYK